MLEEELDFSDDLFKLTERDIEVGLNLWLESDNEKIFNQNLSSDPQNPSLVYYKEHPIEYHTNSDKFRTKEEFTHSNDPGNMFLGCSHTFGIGHHLENVWSYKLNQHIGGRFFNLGIGGNGPMAAYRYFRHFIDKVNIQNVFCYLPHNVRFTVYDGESWLNISPTHRLVWDKVLNKKARMIALEKANELLFTSAIIDSIALQCKIRNIDFYYYSDLPKFGIGVDNGLLARDLVHFPTNAHKQLYETFLEMYESKSIYDKSRANLRVSRGELKLF